MVDAQVRQGTLDLLDFSNEPREEARLARELLDDLARWPAALRESEEWTNARARALLKEGDGLYYAGDSEAALARYREADGLLARSTAPGSQQPSLLMNRMIAAWSVATTLHALGRMDEALRAFDESVEHAERLREFERVDRQMQRNTAITRQARAEAWIDAGRAEEAVPELERVVASHQAAAAAAPGDPSRRRDLASTSIALARAHLAAGRVGEGCGALSRASAICRALIAERALMPGDGIEAIPMVNARRAECATAGFAFEAIER